MSVHEHTQSVIKQDGLPCKESVAACLPCWERSLQCPASMSLWLGITQSVCATGRLLALHGRDVRRCHHEVGALIPVESAEPCLRTPPKAFEPVASFCSALPDS